jgi:hypothetical protein
MFQSVLNIIVISSEYEKYIKCIRSESEDALKDKEVELVAARKEAEFERARAIRLEAMLGCVEKELTTRKTELVEARDKLKDALAESQDLRHRLKASLTTLLDTLL